MELGVQEVHLHPHILLSKEAKLVTESVKSGRRYDPEKVWEAINLDQNQFATTSYTKVYNQILWLRGSHNPVDHGSNTAWASQIFSSPLLSLTCSFKITSINILTPRFSNLPPPLN